MYAAIEAGGTKFVCAVSDHDFTIKDRKHIPTTTPQETLGAVFTFFDQYDIEAIGIGSFGPIDANPESAHYGYITTTPKLAWTNFDFLGAIRAHYPNTKTAFTTDVNVAAFGEFKLGAAQGKKNVAYYTVGTGIGMGYIHNGQIYMGRENPEAGHFLVRRHPDDHFVGACPYHQDCLEGMAAGPALEQRWGKKGKDIDPNSQAWEIEAYYLAQASMNTTLYLSPDIIVFGGGVSKQAQLFPLIRSQFAKILGDYVDVPPISDYIVPVGLGDDAGITGALLLAAEQ
ncbi:ROK family protein [Schleiferilactobacillus perolens]|uniref:Fructokinase n=1 Tax=Schleiferilactobacillus perolens DSM 12744 TaxID=1423792 RepID=A0A0R1MLC7_9LACO|nr:ROK family protein [Schleiferilactobacillus perolens]KRL08481.1 Fructokinase [Schleiferilactobacillus perolens DSM 12744]